MTSATTRPRSVDVPADSFARPGRRPRLTRRNLRLALGALWLLDGVLQLQPYMFTRSFSTGVLAAAAGGQPVVVHGPVLWAAGLVGQHPAVWNSLFAVVQLALGVGLLLGRTAKVAIAASVAWAAGVWLLGEGLGGVLGGTASLVTGAPGAVALYAVIGLALWPAEDHEAAPASWLPAAWAALWTLEAALTAWAWAHAGGTLTAQLDSAGAAAPGWLARADRALAGGLSHLGGSATLVLAAVEVGIGLLALRPGAARRWAVAGGAALAVASWAFGESFGLLWTGQATDVNTGPLLVLLGLGVLAAADRVVPVDRVGGTVAAPGPSPLWPETDPAR